MEKKITVFLVGIAFASMAVALFGVKSDVDITSDSNISTQNAVINGDAVTANLSRIDQSVVGWQEGKLCLLLVNVGWSEKQSFQTHSLVDIALGELQVVDKVNIPYDSSSPGGDKIQQFHFRFENTKSMLTVNTKVYPPISKLFVAGEMKWTSDVQHIRFSSSRRFMSFNDSENVEVIDLKTGRVVFHDPHGYGFVWGSDDRGAYTRSAGGGNEKAIYVDFSITPPKAQKVENLLR